MKLFWTKSQAISQSPVATRRGFQLVLHRVGELDGGGGNTRQISE